MGWLPEMAGRKGKVKTSLETILGPITWVAWSQFDQYNL